MIRKQQIYKMLVTLTTCILNRQYVMAHHRHCLSCHDVNLAFMHDLTKYQHKHCIQMKNDWNACLLYYGSTHSAFSLFAQVLSVSLQLLSIYCPEWKYI